MRWIDDRRDPRLSRGCGEARALLGDFLDRVVREQYRVYGKALSYRMWEDYVHDCRARDPGMPEWSPATIARLRSSVFQILAQAGYIESTRSLKLQPVHIEKEVLQYLHASDEQYVLRCLEVGPMHLLSEMLAEAGYFVAGQGQGDRPQAALAAGDVRTVRCYS